MKAETNRMLNGEASCQINDKTSYGPTVSTLPASWYREEGMYELERRAIFSKRWMCVTHEMRFKEVGDYLKFEIAGYSFFVIRDRNKDLKAFLNICRHRAYPVVEKDSGRASILACRYHGEYRLFTGTGQMLMGSGWSYGLSGNLAKAPRFDTVDGFDKTQYSLFGVHLRIDRLGFIWVNLDAANPPTVPWEDHFSSVDQQPRQKDFSMEDFVFDHEWELEGDYNWKAMIDNYNEVIVSLVEIGLYSLTLYSATIARLRIPASLRPPNWTRTTSRASKGGLSIIPNRWTAWSTNTGCNQPIYSPMRPF